MITFPPPQDTPQEQTAPDPPAPHEKAMVGSLQVGFNEQCYWAWTIGMALAPNGERRASEFIVVPRTPLSRLNAADVQWPHEKDVRARVLALIAQQTNQSATNDGTIDVPLAVPVFT